MPNTPRNSLSSPCWGCRSRPTPAHRDRRGDQRQEVHRPDPRDAPDRLVEAEREAERQGHPQGHRDERVERGVAQRDPERDRPASRAKLSRPTKLRRRRAGPSSVRLMPNVARIGPGREHREADQHGREEQPAPSARSLPRGPRRRGAPPRSVAKRRPIQPDPSDGRLGTVIACRPRPGPADGYCAFAARMPFSCSMTVAIASAAVLLAVVEHVLVELRPGGPS